MFRSDTCPGRRLLVATLHSSRFSLTRPSAASIARAQRDADPAQRPIAERRSLERASRFLRLSRFGALFPDIAASFGKATHRTSFKECFALLHYLEDGLSEKISLDPSFCGPAYLDIKYLAARCSVIDS